MDPLLQRIGVNYRTSLGDKIAVEAIYQDTLPTGSKLGTVVAIHGAPGSYKDFKYITPLLQNKGIRFIGVNMPGFGFTPGDPRLQCNNTERNSFVNELIAKIGNVEKLVVMGHSRGSENAIAIAAENTESLVGLVLVNPTGLQRHRAQRPFWVVEFVLWLYSLGPTAKKVLHPFMKYFYNNVIGLRLDTGERAMMCVRTMASIEYEKGIRAHIESINKCKNARVLVVYAGKDMLIETKIPHELACSFDGHIDLSCKDKDEISENKVVQETCELFSEGTKTISINFETDGHFLQRDRARYIADSIEAILRAD